MTAGHPGLDPGSSPRITQAPVIETERLRLRPFTAEDLDAHAATLGDEQVMLHIGGKPLNREDAWRRLLSSVGMWQLAGMGAWAVERKPDGRMVGHCGFFQFHREMNPSILGEPEMGWIFDRSVHGQGIAFEACHAALEWAESALAAESYPAIIDLENAPSMKLAERLGLREGGGRSLSGRTDRIVPAPGPALTTSLRRHLHRLLLRTNRRHPSRCSIRAPLTPS